MNKTYILQKDLPDYPAGVELNWNGNGYTLNATDPSKQMSFFYSEDYLLSHPTWFKLKEEKTPMEQSYENFVKYIEVKTTIHQAYAMAWEAAEQHFTSKQ